MNDQTLIMRFDYLTDEECMAMVNAIHKILKENNVQTYQVKFGSSVGGGFDLDE